MYINTQVIIKYYKRLLNNKENTELEQECIEYIKVLLIYINEGKLKKSNTKYIKMDPRFINHIILNKDESIKETVSEEEVKLNYLDLLRKVEAFHFLKTKDIALEYQNVTEIIQIIKKIKEDNYATESYLMHYKKIVDFQIVANEIINSLEWLGEPKSKKIK